MSRFKTVDDIFAERFRSSSQKKRARALRAALKNTGDWRCHICGNPLDFKFATIDHIIPLVKKGGKRVASNLKLACRKCNNRRGHEPVHFHKMKLYLLSSYPCISSEHNE